MRDLLLLSFCVCVTLLLTTAPVSAKKSEGWVYQYCPAADNPGCVPGTGSSNIGVTDMTPCNCSAFYHSYCPAGFCEAIIYGGLYGMGQGNNQNEWGVPKPWSTSIVLPINKNTLPLIVGASLVFNGTVSSGYTFPNPLPFVIDIYNNGFHIGRNVQLTTFLRNTKHLPKPHPADMNFRSFEFVFGGEDFKSIAPQNNITIALQTPGWIALQSTTLNIQLCGDECDCQPPSDFTGFWTGPLCDECQKHYSGPNCNFYAKHVIVARYTLVGATVALSVAMLVLLLMVAYSYFKLKGSGYSPQVNMD